MKTYNPPLSGRRNYAGLLLDFNEKTTPPSSRVKQKLLNFINSNQLQIYPEYYDLENKIAKYTKTTAKKILITNGSDQAIDLVFRTFLKKGDRVIIPQPSFSMFKQTAGIIGTKIISPTYSKDNLSFPYEKIMTKINSKIKLILICNPNNPTGTLATLKQISEISKKARQSIIFIDEAYVEYSKYSAVSLIKKYPNIIISRTFSKAFGLSALRIGYLIATPQYIKEIKKIRGPYDMNMAGYYAANTAIEEVKKMKKYVDEVMNKAKPKIENFFKKNNIKYFISKSNFILFKPKEAKKTYSILKNNGFLLRPQKNTVINNTLRLTIGTNKQMNKFIACYQEKILKQKYAFLDRDGVMIYEPQDTYQIDSLDKLKILPGVITGLKKLIKNNYYLVMISNQDGLGTKSFPKKNFTIVQNKLLSVFKANGIYFKNIFICPHFSEDNCNCRKPKIGLINDWLEQHKNQIDWQNSFYCGDRESDYQFAKNLNLKYLKLQTNKSFTPILNKLNIL